MANELQGQKIAFLATDGVEQSELAEPWKAAKNAVRFVRDFFAQGKPVAAICHGPWMLVEADVVKGRTLTSWPSLQTDIRNAGGTWVDEQVHTDHGLVTSRKPDDLPAFCAKMTEEFKEGRHQAQAQAVGAGARG